MSRFASLATLALLLWAPLLLAQTSPDEQGYEAALSSSAPFDLKPSQPRATLHLRRMTIHTLYDEIARAYGIKLIYDSDLPDRPVPGDFDMDDSPFQETLDAAGSISKTFVAPLDSHSGMVAADLGEKRAQYERQIMASFHLDDQLTPQQLSDVTNALRTLVDLRRVTQDTRNNWITVVGRERQIEVADQLVRSLDQAAGEVMLEFHVWEIDRTRARDMGILPPEQPSLQFLGNNSDAPATPLKQLGHLTTLYGVQIPSLTAFLSESRSLVHFQQTVNLRAANGEEASLLVGTRVPVVTGIVSAVIDSTPAPAATAGGTATATSSTTTTPSIISNTQGFIPGIQYQDTGVVIHATPHFHAGGEMSLQLDFALRAQGPTADNGIPIFTNREIISQVRLGFGEAYLIGGILNQTDQTTVSGYPWLSRIPILGWLFGHKSISPSETELLILVKPTILRTAAADQIASRSIFFGKEMTGLPAAPALPPPAPVPQPGQAVPGQPQPGVVPGAQPGVQPGLPPGVVQPGIQPGAQPVPGQPVQPVPGQPVPFPAGGFSPGAPQAFPGQPRAADPPQPAPANPEQ